MQLQKQQYNSIVHEMTNYFCMLLCLYLYNEILWIFAYAKSTQITKFFIKKMIFQNVHKSSCIKKV